MIHKTTVLQSILVAWRFLLLFALSYGAWLLFSLTTEPTALAAGAVFALLTALFSYSTFFSPSFTHSRRRIPRLDLMLVYLLVLLVQSYLSSFTLIRGMLTGTYAPKIVRIRTRLQSSFGRILLANTISMIPGTLSMWMRDRHIYVHCFDIPTTHSIAAGRRIKQRQEHLLLRIFG